MAAEWRAAVARREWKREESRRSRFLFSGFARLVSGGYLLGGLIIYIGLFPCL